MLRSIIVDDELKSRESLMKMLSRFCQDVEVNALCQNVAEGLEAIDTCASRRVSGCADATGDGL